MSDPEGGVATIELRARQVEVKRPRLAEHANPTTFALAKRVEGRPRAEMHQVDRGTRRFREVDGFSHRLHLGIHRTACGEVLDAGPSGRVQLGGAGRDDRVILRVHRDEHARFRRRSQEEPVIVAPLHEPWRDHEDLEPRVAVT